MKKSKENSHLGGYFIEGDPFTWMPDIWGFLLLTYDIHSVVDIGCGTGVNLSWFHSMKTECLGIEGDQFAIENSKIKNVLVQHDFSLGPYSLDRKFDLCISTEFVEHVEAIYEKNWLTVVDSSKYFLMCHAIPGQGGHHHVNEQSSEYWIEKLERRNFKHISELSTKFRNTTKRYPTKWGRNTLLFFENNNI
jgi:SAM-dependent methyltransferase